MARQFVKLELKPVPTPCKFGAIKVPLNEAGIALEEKVEGNEYLMSSSEESSEGEEKQLLDSVSASRLRLGRVSVSFRSSMTIGVGSGLCPFNRGEEVGGSMSSFLQESGASSTVSDDGGFNSMPPLDFSISCVIGLASRSLFKWSSLSEMSIVEFTSWVEFVSNEVIGGKANSIESNSLVLCIRIRSFR